MPIYNAPLGSIDPKETRRYAGLSIADFDENTIRQACNDMLYIANPRGSWNLYNYDNTTGTVLSENPFKIYGTKILKHLSHCEKVIILAVTIGDEVEKIIEQSFQDGSYVYALLLDAAATTAVEQAADNLEKNIEPRVASMGYKRIWRFSPGYGDWDINCQPEMLSLSAARAINITCTSSMMLSPRKSVTAIIGLVPKTDEFSPQKPSCSTCSQIDCPSRLK